MSISHFKTAYQRQIAIWVLRSLAPGMGRKEFIKDSSFVDDDLVRFLGLSSEDKVSAAQEGAKMDAMLLALEGTSRPIGLTRRAAGNIARFSWELGFSDVEMCLLKFLIALRIEPLLVDARRLVDSIYSRDPGRYFAKVIGLPRAAVEKALRREAGLRSSRLLVEEEPRFGGKSMIEFASVPAAQLLFRDRYDEVAILRQFGIRNPCRSALTLSCYPHLKTDVELLMAHLGHSIKERKQGVNILLHGVPGTGKTQLSRLLGAELGVEVFEVETSESGAELLEPQARLEKLDFVDAFLNVRPSLIVFDEAEDIFGSSFLNRSTAATHKGWFNRMLERNRWPVIWISNTIRGLDPAFARRFDIILEVPVPPRRLRYEMVKKELGKAVRKPLMESIAADRNVSPAVLKNASHVLRGIDQSISGERKEEVVVGLLTSTLKAQGHRPGFNRSVVHPRDYELDYLNPSEDLSGIVENLRSGTGARLCLYGPPGTGKTSFGYWLADQLDSPIVVKRASDVLGSYVGETERAIRESFDEAESEGAVLMIDEVDSFLASRASARSSWEISGVNEMLSGMESFPGILIASTNRLEALDPASLRRFDLKVLFDYLRGDQFSLLFENKCRLLGLPEPGKEQRRIAENCVNQTPGDLAAVARRHQFSPFRDPGEFLSAILAEAELRKNQSRPIGFA